LTVCTILAIINKKGVKMELFGRKIKIEKVDSKERELEEAFAVLAKHGYRALTEEKELEEAFAILEKYAYRAVKLTEDKSKKIASAGKANEAKIKATRAKLQNGLNLWRLEGEQDKKLTAYKLGQLAGVSQNTAKKFLEEIDAI